MNKGQWSEVYPLNRHLVKKYFHEFENRGKTYVRIYQKAGADEIRLQVSVRGGVFLSREYQRESLTAILEDFPYIKTYFAER